MKVQFPSGADLIQGELELPAEDAERELPTRSPPQPAGVVIPDVGGLSDLYRGFARKLADEGFAFAGIAGLGVFPLQDLGAAGFMKTECFVHGRSPGE